MKTFEVTYVINGKSHKQAINAVDANDAIDQLGNEIEFDSAVAVES